MGILDPRAALRFGPPRQAGFATPGTQAPPMPGPGFSPLLGPAPGASPNALPRAFSGGLRDRVSGFAGRHPIIADNSSMLLQMGLGLLSGGGNPNRSWAAAQQGAAYGQQADSQRRATSKAEEEAAAEEAEWEAILAELPIGEDERQVLGMMDPGGRAEAAFNILTASTDPVVVNGQLVNPRTGEVVGDFRDPQAAELFGPIVTGAKAASLNLDPALRWQQGPDREWHEVGGSGVKFINNVGANGVQLPDPPDGFDYRRTPDGLPIIGPDGVGELVPIPGGPAAQEAAGIEQAGEARLAQTATGGGEVLGTITEALDLMEASPAQTTGAGAKASSWMPGSSGYHMAELLTTIRANIGFDKLQAMRNASETGGALGQVAIWELEQLQATIASLDQFQDYDTLRDNLTKVEEHYERYLWALDPNNAEEAQRQLDEGLNPGPSGGTPIDPNRGQEFSTLDALAEEGATPAGAAPAGEDGWIPAPGGGAFRVVP